MLVESERRGHVAVIYLNDDKRKNVLSTALVDEAIAAISDSGRGPNPARAIVLANRGADFCAGADIRDMLDTGWLQPNIPAESGKSTPIDLFKLVDAEQRPVVAAVRGLVLGGGVELATVCDLVLASRGATFRLPEIGLGVLPNTALARLPAIIGRRRAAELILSRRPWSAEEAERLGFVNSITSEDELIDQAVAIASSIVSAAPPTAVGGAKKALRVADWDSIDQILRSMDEAEWREGTTAFVEKRKPSYERFWSQE